MRVRQSWELSHSIQSCTWYSGFPLTYYMRWGLLNNWPKRTSGSHTRFSIMFISLNFSLSFLLHYGAYIQPHRNHAVLLFLGLPPPPPYLSNTRISTLSCKFTWLSCWPSSLVVRVLVSHHHLYQKLLTSHLMLNPHYQLGGEWSSPQLPSWCLFFGTLSVLLITSLIFWIINNETNKSTKVYWEITPVKGKERKWGWAEELSDSNACLTKSPPINWELWSNHYR